MCTDLESVDLVRDLSQLFDAHEVPFHVENEWVVPFGRLPAIRATWFPREQSGRLDVEVLLDDEGTIIYECFAGFGAPDTGKADAIKNFCINSFHVLLAAFWEDNDPEQVTTERWLIGERAYTAFIGNFGTRGSKGLVPELPPAMFETIENAVKSQRFNGNCYWLRNFFADVEGEQTFESLLNNEVWDHGLHALRSIEWPKSDGYYSVRNFIVLTTADD